MIHPIGSAQNRNAFERFMTVTLQLDCCLTNRSDKIDGIQSGSNDPKVRVFSGLAQTRCHDSRTRSRTHSPIASKYHRCVR